MSISGYERLVRVIIAVTVLSVVSLGVSLYSFQRTARLAEAKAEQAVTTAQQAGANAAIPVCRFVLSFIAKGDEPLPTTPRGVLTEQASRDAYAAIGCPRLLGPAPPRPPR